MASMLDSKIHREITDHVKDSFKLLLESKHLYQSTVPDFDPKRLPDILAVMGKERSTLVSEWEALREGPRYLSAFLDSPKPSPDLPVPPFISFRPSDIKVFCGICNRIEPLNLIDCYDLLVLTRTEKREYVGNQGVVQIFSFTYLCQGCKSIPEVFLVRRDIALPLEMEFREVLLS